jgi:hypothetical protein
LTMWGSLNNCSSCLCVSLQTCSWVTSTSWLLTNTS